MKKIITLLLALIMMVNLVACGTGEDSVTFSRGVVEGDVYTSEFAGIKFTAPEGFRYYSDEEIAAVNGISEELIDVETIDTVVYDMYCIDETTGCTVNINFENLGNLYGALLDEKAYIELSLETLETTLEGTGISITSTLTGVVDIHGHDLKSAELVLDYGGITVCETIFVKEIDGNMMCCTVAAMNDETVDAIISYFEVI